MPEREARSLHVNNGKSVQPINPHQSAWLTHWAGTRFESATHDHLAQFGRSEGDDQDIKKHLTGIEIASDNFGTSKGVRDVDLAMSLKKPGSQSFPFFKRGQESVRSAISNEGGETRVPAFGPQGSHKKLTPALNVGTSSREHHFQPQGESKIPLEQVKYHMFFGDSSYSGSRPSKEKFANSHTTHGPENFRQLTAAFASKDHLPEANFLGQEHPSYCSHSAALNNFPKHEKSEMPPFLRQNKAAVTKNDPSTSRSPAFLEEQYKRMQKHIGMGFFPQQSGSPETTKSGRPCSFQDVPHFVHDVEMARICAAPLTSVEGLPGGLHSFSRTTHSLLITKQTDGKLYQENQIFRESRVSTQLKGDALRELNCIPSLVSHGQRGVKLQLLDSSDQSQENFEDVKAAADVQKNESSADTDAMDMESFKENRLSGVHLSSPNKNIMVESKLPLPPPIGLSTEKDTRKKRLIELPDINLDLSALPAASISAEKPEPCSSRTQSLDMNTLQFNNSSNSKSDECSDSNLGSDPGIRWIKRLKLSTSSSLALGTKTPKLAESSTNGKLNEHKPEPALDICNVKDSVSLKGKRLHKESGFQIGECSTKEQQHPSTVSFGKGDSSSLETKREIKDITLSHSWIQRWSHNQNQKNQKAVEVCKAESGSKPAATEEFEKKQFPSIAAMALMGKAMTGFQQCKFQKKESCVVWNTKSFEQ